MLSLQDLWIVSRNFWIESSFPWFILPLLQDFTQDATISVRPYLTAPIQIPPDTHSSTPLLPSLFFFFFTSSIIQPSDLLYTFFLTVYLTCKLNENKEFCSFCSLLYPREKRGRLKCYWIHEIQVPHLMKRHTIFFLAHIPLF